VTLGGGGAGAGVAEAGQERKGPVAVAPVGPVAVRPTENGNVVLAAAPPTAGRPAGARNVNAATPDAGAALRTKGSVVCPGTASVAQDPDPKSWISGSRSVSMNCRIRIRYHGSILPTH